MRTLSIATRGYLPGGDTLAIATRGYIQGLVLERATPELYSFVFDVEAPTFSLTAESINFSLGKDSCPTVMISAQEPKYSLTPIPYLEFELYE